MASARVVAPDDVELELTVRMPVKQWKELAHMLPQRWPAWPLASLIEQSIRGTVEHVETARESTA